MFVSNPRIYRIYIVYSSLFTEKILILIFACKNFNRLKKKYTFLCCMNNLMFRHSLYADILLSLFRENTLLNLSLEILIAYTPV